MGKIRQLREDQLINGGSQEPIYPVTHSKAVYTKDNEVLQDVIDNIKSGIFLSDNSIKTRHLQDKSVTNAKLAKDSVTTDKVKDMSITTDKIAHGAIDTDRIAGGAVTTDNIADGAVTESELADDAVTTDKIKDSVVTTDKIRDKAVKNDKLSDESVDNRVLAMDAVDTENIVDKSITTNKIADRDITEEKMAEDSVSTMAIIDKNVTEEKLADNAVTTDKIDNAAVTTSKINNGAITNEKVADGSLTLDKFDDDLKDAIEAASGLPSDVLQKFQNLSEDVAELQDSMYPITLAMNLSYNAGYHTVNFSVKLKGQPYVGDSLYLTKTLADNTVKTLTDIPAASGVAQSPVESNREIFKLEVGADGHTTKSTSATRYICYAGSNASNTISPEVISSLEQYSSSNVAFNPTVATSANQYLWLVVPSYLTINRVTSQGFNVTLAPAQNITTSLGSFKAYRTANTLTAQTWNLIIL